MKLKNSMIALTLSAALLCPILAGCQDDAANITEDEWKAAFDMSGVTNYTATYRDHDWEREENGADIVGIKTKVYKVDGNKVYIDTVKILVSEPSGKVLEKLLEKKEYYSIENNTGYYYNYDYESSRWSRETCSADTVRLYADADRQIKMKYVDDPSTRFSSFTYDSKQKAYVGDNSRTVVKITDGKVSYIKGAKESNTKEWTDITMSDIGSTSVTLPRV